jgi:ectoine hydroxylase-related dioxygenase (phytanoyl-CoA dioxygenase family)
VWVPINDAPVETGCLQFLRGVHKSGLKKHDLGRVDGLTLPGDVADAGTVDIVPAKRGDILLIHRHCPHASLPNVSDQLRFSLDLRFHPAGQPSGRDVLPSFIARSRSDPSRELSDPEAWTEMWNAARTWLATSPEAPRSSYAWLGQANS